MRPSLESLSPFRVRIAERDRYHLGFTLLELMVALSILAILVTLAAPAMEGMVLRQRVRNAAFDLNAAMLFARSEAMKRNGDVSITNKNGVSSTDWKDGWEVRGVVSGVTVVLKGWNAYPGLTITGPAGGVTFNRSGRAATLRFSVDDDRGIDTVDGRCLRLDSLGRPVSSVGACT